MARLPKERMIPVLTERIKSELNDISSQYIASVLIVERAKIVLLAAEGASNQDISATLHIHRNCVSKWRKRFTPKLPKLREVEKDFPKKLHSEIINVLSDSHRPGAPRTYSEEQRAFVVSIACNDVTDHDFERSHWCCSILTEVVH